MLIIINFHLSFIVRVRCQSVTLARMSVAELPHKRRSLIVAVEPLLVGVCSLKN